jgi:predicted tellurium resistance membrane protein TerC
MDFNIIVGLLLFIGLIYYFYQAYTSQKNKKRIVDLLAVGVVLWLTLKLSAYINREPFEVSGILVFAYGWGILIIEKFWEGLDDKKSKQPKE